MSIAEWGYRAAEMADGEINGDWSISSLMGQGGDFQLLVILGIGVERASNC